MSTARYKAKIAAKRKVKENRKSGVYRTHKEATSAMRNAGKKSSPSSRSSSSSRSNSHKETRNAIKDAVRRGDIQTASDIRRSQIAGRLGQYEKAQTIVDRANQRIFSKTGGMSQNDPSKSALSFAAPSTQIGNRTIQRTQTPSMQNITNIPQKPQGIIDRVKGMIGGMKGTLQGANEKITNVATLGLSGTTKKAVQQRSFQPFRDYGKRVQDIGQNFVNPDSERFSNEQLNQYDKESYNKYLSKGRMEPIQWNAGVKSLGQFAGGASKIASYAMPWKGAVERLGGKEPVGQLGDYLNKISRPKDLAEASTMRQANVISSIFPSGGGKIAAKNAKLNKVNNAIESTVINLKALGEKGLSPKNNQVKALNKQLDNLHSQRYNIQREIGGWGLGIQDVSGGKKSPGIKKAETVSGLPSPKTPKGTDWIEGADANLKPINRPPEAESVRIKMNQAFDEINNQAAKGGTVNAKKWREANKLADEYWKIRDNKPVSLQEGGIKKTTPKSGIPKDAGEKLEKFYQQGASASSTKSSLGQTTAASMQNTGNRMPGRLPQESPISGLPPEVPVSYGSNKAGSPEGVKPRGFVETIRQSEKTTPEVAEGIGGRYNPITNKATIEKANQSIAKDFEGAVRRAKTQEHLTTDVQAESLRLIDELQAKGRTQDAIDIVEKMSERATAGGQAEQILAAYNRLTPEGILQTAQRQVEKARKLNPEKFGKLKLSPDDAGKFRKMAEDVKNIPPGEAKDAATREMLDELARLVPTPWARKLTTLWKAGLLTGVKGAIGGNTVGNTAMTVLKKISDVPAAGIDNALALATGNRSKVFTMKGLLGGAWEGLKEGIGNMRKGIGAGSVANKLDYQKTYFGKGILGRAAQKYTDTVFNAYSALDRPFFHSALKNNLYDFAKVEAKNKGLSGKAATEFVEKLVKEPTDEILSLATEAAEKVVFQDKNAVGAALSGAKQGLKKYGGSTGEIVSEGLMPFTGVPSSITMAVHNYGPTGAVQGALKAITAVKNGNFDKAAQRMLAESLGKGITGTGVILIGMKLTDSGQMTLGYPKDKGEQVLWEAEGKIPYAIKLFGKWRSLNYTGPIMSLLAIGGEIQTAKKSGDSGLTAIGTGALGSGKAIISSSPLQGAQAGINAITDPQRYGSSYMKNQASSVVPTIVKDIAAAGDPLQRETNTMSEALQSKIPGIRKDLLPKRDIFGEEVPRKTSAMGAIFDPLRSSEEKSTPVMSEFRRLQDAGFGPTLSGIDKKQKINGKDVVFTPEELDKFEQYVGSKAKQEIEKLIGGDSYKAMDDEGKQGAINDVFNLLKKEARIKLFGSNEKYPENIVNAKQKYEEYKGLSDNEFKMRMIELKDQGDAQSDIADDLMEYKRNDMAKEMQFEYEGDWSNLKTQDKANVVMKKINGLSDEDKTRFFKEMVDRDFMTDPVKKETGIQLYDKMKGSLDKKIEGLNKFEDGSEIRSTIVKVMFNDINNLKAENGEEATALVNKLSDADYETYKDARQTWRAGNTKKLDELMKVNTDEGVEFLRSLYKEEQTRILDTMTDEEWEVYKSAKEDYGNKTISDLEQKANEFYGSINKDLYQRDTEYRAAVDKQIALNTEAEQKLANTMRENTLALSGTPTATQAMATPAGFEAAGGMRTDRNNNPTAMTTDVAREMGLVEGVDYVNTGDAFPKNPKLFTAKLLGDPVETTIKGIDQGGFYSPSGKQRWSYIAMSDAEWGGLSHEEKVATIAKMYATEGGNGNLMNSPAQQYAMTPEQTQIATAVGTGQMTLDQGVQAVMAETPTETSTVTTIPTTAQADLTTIPEQSRTSAWLAAQNFPQWQSAFNIYYVMGMLQGLYQPSTQPGNYAGIPNLI